MNDCACIKRCLRNEKHTDREWHPGVLNVLSEGTWIMDSIFRIKLMCDRSGFIESIPFNWTEPALQQKAINIQAAITVWTTSVQPYEIWQRASLHKASSLRLLNQYHYSYLADLISSWEKYKPSSFVAPLSDVCLFTDVAVPQTSLYTHSEDKSIMWMIHLFILINEFFIKTFSQVTCNNPSVLWCCCLFWLVRRATV